MYSEICIQRPPLALVLGHYREVVSVLKSKSSFGTQPSGLYREVVSVQRSKSVKEPLGPNQGGGLCQINSKGAGLYREVVSGYR